MRTSRRPPADGPPPWPGRLPPPAPAVVTPEPVAVEVLDAAGAPVGVTGRGLATGEPAALRVAGGGGWVGVEAWAGPWPVEQRWWDGGGQRLARLQVLGDDGVARLLALEGGRWWQLAVYD